MSVILISADPLSPLIQFESSLSLFLCLSSTLYTAAGSGSAVSDLSTDSVTMHTLLAMWHTPACLAVWRESLVLIALPDMDQSSASLARKWCGIEVAV